MKRTRPKRKTELKRSGTPMRAKKADKSKRRFAKLRCEPFLEALRGMACAISGKRDGNSWLATDGHLHWSFVHAAHVKSRGAGGGDLYNALPLHGYLHAEQHLIGIKSFEKKYGVDLLGLAHVYTERWLETDEGQAWAASHPGCAERGDAA